MTKRDDRPTADAGVENQSHDATHHSGPSPEPGTRETPRTGEGGSEQDGRELFILLDGAGPEATQQAIRDAWSTGRTAGGELRLASVPDTRRDADVR